MPPGNGGWKLSRIFDHYGGTIDDFTFFPSTFSCILIFFYNGHILYTYEKVKNNRSWLFKRLSILGAGNQLVLFTEVLLDVFLESRRKCVLSK